MLQCEPLAVAAYCICWATVHGGERRSRHGGVQEAGKRGGSDVDGPRLCVQQALARVLQQAPVPGRQDVSAAQRKSKACFVGASPINNLNPTEHTILPRLDSFTSSEPNKPTIHLELTIARQLGLSNITDAQ
jgi:hypothetical protein